jgi:hypothetical protein
MWPPQSVRIARSAALSSISIRPSSTYRTSTVQCASAYLIAVASGDFVEVSCHVHFAPPWTPSACPSKPKRVSLTGVQVKG